jgi:phosphoribosylformimino-5-aminoimidazole carboxamide ribotide isomerase
VGTAAFTQEIEDITDCGETFAAIDYARGAIQVKGWTSQATKMTPEILSELENKGITGFLATDTARDGTLKGTRTETLLEIVAAARTPVYAAGGVASLGNVREIARAGAAGIVIGKALYEKRFTLTEAIEAAGEAAEVAKQC